MEYLFTLFEPRRERSAKTNTPLVEIRPNGRIVFNKTATDLLLDHRFCMLGYDAKNQTLGVLPLAEQKTNSFAIRYAAKGAYVGAKKFFRHFALLPQESLQTTPFQVNDFIAVKLSEPSY